MGRWIAMVGVCAALAGCVGLGDTLKQYEGGDIQAVVAKIGYPTNQQQIMGKTVYRWNTGNPYSGGWYCNLSITVGDSGHVEAGSWDGNAGCTMLQGRLD